MGDEVTAAQGQGTADSAATIVVPDAATIAASTGKTDGLVDKGAGLFADEQRFTADQLSGEVEETGDTKTGDSAQTETKDKPAASQPQGEQGKESTTGAQDGADKTVPLAALHEERTKRQARDAEIAQERGRRISLEAENAALKQRVEATPVTPETPPEFADFKVLTEDEFTELANEDTLAGQRYLLKLANFQDWKRNDQVKQETQHRQIVENNRRAASIVQASIDEIAASVPGIYETVVVQGPDGQTVEKCPVSDALVEFAESNGMDIGYLSAITDPATRLIIVGRDGKAQTLLAARGAASLLKGLYQLHTKINGNASEVAKLAQDKAGQIIADKMRQDTGFRSIGDSPGSGEIPNDSTKVYSEDELFKMRQEEGGDAKRRQYLGG